MKIFLDLSILLLSSFAISDAVSDIPLNSIVYLSQRYVASDTTFGARSQDSIIDDNLRHNSLLGRRSLKKQSVTRLGMKHTDLVSLKGRPQTITPLEKKVIKASCVTGKLQRRGDCIAQGQEQHTNLSQASNSPNEPRPQRATETLSTGQRRPSQALSDRVLPLVVAHQEAKAKNSNKKARAIFRQDRYHVQMMNMHLMKSLDSSNSRYHAEAMHYTEKHIEQVAALLSKNIELNRDEIDANEAAARLRYFGVKAAGQADAPNPPKPAKNPYLQYQSAISEEINRPMDFFRLHILDEHSPKDIEQLAPKLHDL